MRCFIALDISAEVREAVGAVIERVRPAARGVRWVAPYNIHLTLKFLGEIREETVPGIRRTLSSVCSRHRSFALAIQGTGAFPSLKQPSVIWAGIGDSEELEALYRDIEDSLHVLGFVKEGRKFSPHLTMGRVKERTRKIVLDKEFAALKDTFFGTIEAKEILLMKSELKPAGAEYAKVAGFALNNKA
ncbi:MAG: RNA 2',3'-cyclic phosphodiesterase [Nitrospirales bacterium]|nr:RNA 2',3'-cyclic phosphodiesterase [Nitrospirales bacterium]